MPYKVAKRGDRYHVVKSTTGERATVGPGQRGGPVKKGGHSSRAAALAQVRAINLSLRRAAGKSAPPRKGK